VDGWVGGDKKPLIDALISRAPKKCKYLSQMLPFCKMKNFPAE
jgi:hypothetical protein